MYYVGELLYLRCVCVRMYVHCDYRYNAEYGLGYMWNPQHITVTIGDTINWSWTGSTFGPMRNVAQVVMCLVT